MQVNANLAGRRRMAGQKRRLSSGDVRLRRKNATAEDKGRLEKEGERGVYQQSLRRTSKEVS